MTEHDRLSAQVCVNGACQLGLILLKKFLPETGDTSAGLQGFTASVSSRLGDANSLADERH
jgi:hypothetical protein